MKKGFTLIELLTVIIVITIISLITVPIILNVIESARKASFKDSVLIAYRSIDLKLYELKLDEMPDEGLEVTDLNIKSKFKSGKFIKNELGKTISYFITDGEYCAYGEIRNLKIEKGCQNLDITGPVIDESKLIITSSSSEIKVNILEGFAIDNESGIKNYKVNLYKDNDLIDTKNLKEIGEIIFDKLPTNTEYKLEIIVSNKKGLEESLNKKVTTKIIDTPTYSLDKSGWSTSKTVTINYPSGYTNEYSLDSGLTWKPYTTPITFTSNGSIIARVTDGTNYITGSSQTINQIDRTAPTCTNSGDSTSWSTSRIINYGCTDSESGCHTSYSGGSIKYTVSTKTATIPSYTIKDNAGNTTVCPARSANIYSDASTPKITLNSGDYQLTNTNQVYSVTYGISGGTIKCVNTSRNNAIVTNYSSINALGPNVVTCTATSTSKVTKTATATMNMSKTYNANDSLYPTDGAYQSGSSLIVPSGGRQYGPYVYMKPGCYRVSYSGSNLNIGVNNQMHYQAYNNAGKINFPLLNHNFVSTEVLYYLKIDSDADYLETVFTNGSTSTATINSVNIRYEGIPSSCPSS